MLWLLVTHDARTSAAQCGASYPACDCVVRGPFTLQRPFFAAIIWLKRLATFVIRGHLKMASTLFLLMIILGMFPQKMLLLYDAMQQISGLIAFDIEVVYFFSKNEIIDDIF